MTSLTVNYSPGLLDLLQTGEAPVQGIEFTPWQSPQKIAGLRGQLPGLAFHFHHGNLLAQLKWDAGAVERLRAFLACTDTPWVSAHLSMLPPGVAWLAHRIGIYLREPDPGLSFDWMVDEAGRLGEISGLPVLLENMPAFRRRRYLDEIKPDRIRRALGETGAGLLLDLPHARSAAHALDVDVRDYLTRLPLDQTCQIHVSGPRMKGQALIDAHQPMGEEDYALLEWALAQTKPEVVTLEYSKDKQALAEQLASLAAMLS